jgi:hypothetical protein
MTKLNNAQDAIQQAIEGGYSYNGVVKNFTKNNKQMAIVSLLRRGDELMLDPLFWQALGKARGWDPEPEGTPDGGYANNSWESVALDWFLNRLSSGDETEFWESLP